MIPQAYNLFENQPWNKTLWPLCTEDDEYYCMMDLMHTITNRWKEVRLTRLKNSLERLRSLGRAQD